jgi:hypothetical protein
LFNLFQENGRNGLTTKKARENGEGGRDGLAYSCLLKNELLGARIEDVKGQCDERRAVIPVEGTNLFQVFVIHLIYMVLILFFVEM